MKDKTNDTTSALVPAAMYPALAQEAAELHGLVEEYLSDGLTQEDLHLIKMPSGGGRAWDLPDEEASPTFTGVLLAIQQTRAYFPQEFSGMATAPQCSSRDGQIGIGEPGGSCARCPFALWGSGKNGVGTACQPRKICYVLRPDDVLPVRLALPVTSFTPLRKYQVLLLNRRLRPSAVSTIFGLSVAVSKGGIKYSQATFSVGGQLSPEVASRARAYATLLTSVLKTEPADPAPMGETGVIPTVDDDDVPFDWNSGKAVGR